MTAVAPAHAVGLTSPDQLAKTYELILDARFDEAEQQLKEVIRQISDLSIGRRDIKREDYPVMRSSSFPPFVVFQ